MQSIKNKIKQSFSKAATTYDQYAKVQNTIGDLLLKNWSFIGKVLDIMEIGCGTGNFTEKLLRQIPSQNLNLVLLDFSSEMLQQSMIKLSEKFPDVHFDFLAEDAENIGLDHDKQFDAIVSNSTFQWFFNFQETLQYYASLLKKNGVILFSIFGKETFFELSNVLQKAFADKGFSIPSSRFLSRKELSFYLKSLFKNVKIHEYRLKEEHDSLLDLLRTIRYTGEYGMGLENSVFLTPQKLKEMEKDYKLRYGKIEATYHFYICSGVKQ